MSRILHTYTVVPSLPESLIPLQELAYNLRWSWDYPTVELFQNLDAALWEESEHNPARMLGLVAQSRLTEAAADKTFLKQLDTVYKSFRAYMEDTSWWGKTYGEDAKDTLGFGDKTFRIAYFSAEFGITECLPIYSGGLGVLAGDHLKSASDLNLPLVAVGFLYQRGYFRQSLNADGWQIENYPQTDFYSLPIQPVNDKDGNSIVISVDFPGRQVHVKVWKAQVGRVPLYLLDTNLPQNNEQDRFIAGNLYGGDSETRIQQEIVLGIGGIHALNALGIAPSVCHMNEGHSAFMALERVRRIMTDHKLNFTEAAEAAAAGNLFTTHTPVPAGFDRFPEDLMRRYFEGYAATIGLSFDELMDRGRVNAGDRNETFNMAVLAFRHARYINGVSKLHGLVTRRMAQPSWPDFPLDEVPVGSVTNGIHTRSFVAPRMAELHDRYLGEATVENLADPAFWAKIDTVPDAELWAVHEECRKTLVEWARQYQVGKLLKRNASEREVTAAREILDPNILTVGFARRFATYKRGDLLLRDMDRIKQLMNNPDRPIQFVFAGKAHPKDDAGKDFIRRIVHFTRGEDVRRRFVFLEDYEITMARYLVQGVDLWLNNPRRPMEASGTSGMKVVANGGLNFSVLDGWWAEGYDPTVGWEIGRGEDYTDDGYQDYIESMAIYETLEHDIVPLFYKRDANGIPVDWIAKVKASIKKLAPVYTTARMVREYAETYYLPSGKREHDLAANDFARARAMVQWKKKIRDCWGDVRIQSVESEADKIAAGQHTPIHVSVHLGETLTPADVVVQLYTGPVDASRNLIEAQTIDLETVAKPVQKGVYGYTGELPTQQSGQQGYTVRVLPYHPDAVLPQELPLIRWE